VHAISKEHCPRKDAIIQQISLLKEKSYANIMAKAKPYSEGSLMQLATLKNDNLVERALPRFHGHFKEAS